MSEPANLNITDSGGDLHARIAEAQPGSIVELPISGAWVYIPRVHSDARGGFHEWFRAEQFAEQLGYPFEVAQGNLSRSALGVVRGVHLADVPPGQAKFVSCVSGQVRDVLVDLREGSPTFGKHVSVTLSEQNNLGVFVPLGVGHGFAAETSLATVSYLVSDAYNPDREFEVNPFDPALGIDWGVDPADAVASDKDRNAPLLADVRERLPQWREVRGWEQELRREWQEAMDAADQYADDLTDSPQTGRGRA